MGNSQMVNLQVGILKGKYLVLVVGMVLEGVFFRLFGQGMLV